MITPTSVGESRLTSNSARTRVPQPIRLGRDPILDAVCELRFKSTQAAVADVMQGLLYGPLRGTYPKINALPAAQLPRMVREVDPAFANAPLYELVGEGKRIFGTDCSVDVAVASPYPGWTVFKGLALEAFQVALGTGLVSEVERVSVKYVNLLPATPSTSLQEVIEAQIQVGTSAFSRGPLQLRTESSIDGHTVILSLTTNATAQREGKMLGQGLVVDIDVVSKVTIANTVDAISEALEHAHAVEKDFFYSLITKKTLEACEPIYDAAN